MGEDKVKTIYGTFETREAADRAVEHLVQQYGIDRADIFVQAARSENTAGTVASGGDADAGAETGAALQGKIEVSADVRRDEIAKAGQALAGAGAVKVVTR